MTRADLAAAGLARADAELVFARRHLDAADDPERAPADDLVASAA